MSTEPKPKAKRKKWIVLATALVVVLAIPAAVLYWLVNWTPSFYRQTLSLPREGRSQKSKRLVQRATQLGSDIESDLDWQVAFPEEEINAWLATEFPTLLRRYGSGSAMRFKEFRLVLQDDEVLLGATYQGRWFSPVVWMRLETWVPQPGVVAVRFRQVRVGALPLPTARVLEWATEAAHRVDIPIEWKQAGNDPVALVNVGVRAALRELEHVELRPEVLYMEGRGEAGRETARPIHPLRR